MLRVREYGQFTTPRYRLTRRTRSGGHMDPVACGLARSYRVAEPFQRGSGGERLSVVKHLADLHEIITVYAPGSHHALGRSILLARTRVAGSPRRSPRWVLAVRKLRRSHHT